MQRAHVGLYIRILMIDIQYACIQYIIEYRLYYGECWCVYMCVLTKADLPTPPEPRTTSLYSRILLEMMMMVVMVIKLRCLIVIQEE